VPASLPSQGRQPALIRQHPLAQPGAVLPPCDRPVLAAVSGMEDNWE